MIRLLPILSVVAVVAGVLAGLALAHALSRGDLLAAVLYTVTVASAFRASTEFARLAAWSSRERKEPGARE